MSGLTGLCACVCVQSRSEAFFLPCFWLHMGGGKETWSRSDLSPPFKSSGQKKKKKLPKSRPQLPSLSASFRRFLITRLRLRSVPRPPSSSPSRGPLFFVYLPPLLAHAIHFNASCLLICLTRVKRQITPPLQCHLPLSSQCFFRSVENQELPQIMLRFNQPCRAFFFFVGTVLQHPSKTSLRRRSTRSFGDVCFLFDVLSDLPTPCVRGNDV